MQSHPSPDTPRGRPGRRAVLAAAAGVAATAAVGGYLLERDSGKSGRSGSAARPGVYRFQRMSGPNRTVVLDTNGKTLAVLTDGARTALLAGPARTWSEPRTTRATVHHGMWVRLLPEAWMRGRENSAWFGQWLPRALADRGADVLDVAFQYGNGAPDRYNSSGVRYAGAASYGPQVPGQPDNSAHARAEGSDFYDYLGIPWTFPGNVAGHPDHSRYGDVDCSGFMRLVWGYRTGLPLHSSNGPGPGLPRRAFAMAAHAPGVQLTRGVDRPPTDFSMLQPGDLVFFAIDSKKPAFVDHCGLYLGLDNGGHARFYSSRIAADGPTMGDVAGTAVVDGSGFYAQGFRAARRL